MPDWHQNRHLTGHARNHSIVRLLGRHGGATLLLAFFLRKTGPASCRGNSRYPTIVNRQSSIVNSFPPVSIIICARNEEANLERHLDRILNQTYRSLEILLVLHKSSDNSLNVLSSLQRKFSHLRIVVCDDERAGKKFALAKGIEQAKHQVLLLTDADCVPASPDWVQGMVAGMDEDTHIVLGVAPYDEAPGPLNKFVRYEACYTAMQYLSFRTGRASLHGGRSEPGLPKGALR
ncbi:MAG: glycosyltransferase [Saprospiraceae bacterium]|nr:glycosyltransferase [Saprospiraceae bacterium]